MRSTACACWTGEQRQARAAIDAAYDLAVKRYKAGMGNYLSVLIAQTGVLTQARLDTDLRIRAYQLDADLACALGGGYPAAPPPQTPSPRPPAPPLTDRPGFRTS